MKKCIEKYNANVCDYATRYQLMGSTFFNGRYKDYLDSEPVKSPKQEQVEEPEITEEELIKQLDAEGVKWVN